MTTTTTTIFATRKPTNIERIKGFLFRLWFQPYAYIRGRFTNLYSSIRIMYKRQIKL